MARPFIFKHTAFGLVIDSEFYLPELECGVGEAEIQFNASLVPFDAEPGDISRMNCSYIISSEEFTFLIKHVAKYSVQNGSRIIIEPYNNADIRTIRAYLLGMGLGVLLIQKGLIPIHGSAVRIKKKAVIFTGNNGAGKTTLCSWFQKNGYGYLADDISAIKLDNFCTPMVQPGYSQQKICKDTAAHLDINVGELPLASIHDAKCVMNNNSLFVSRQIPLKGIVEIVEAENSHPEIRKITGIEKIHYFMRNIYCASLYQEIGFSNEFFENCLQVVKQVDIYQLLRPKGIFSAEAQMRLVIENLFPG